MEHVALHPALAPTGKVRGGVGPAVRDHAPELRAVRRHERVCQAHIGAPVFRQVLQPPSLACTQVTRQACVDLLCGFAGGVWMENDLEAALPTAIHCGAAHSAHSLLLSPACASFDQYKDFEARGEDFRRLVKAAQKP